jgi:hypothetical protein
MLQCIPSTIKKKTLKITKRIFSKLKKKTVKGMEEDRYNLKFCHFIWYLLKYIYHHHLLLKILKFLNLYSSLLSQTHVKLDTKFELRTFLLKHPFFLRSCKFWYIFCSRSYWNKIKSRVLELLVYFWKSTVTSANLYCERILTNKKGCDVTNIRCSFSTPLKSCKIIYFKVSL